MLSGAGIINLVSGADPFPWYPALDLATIPPHVAAGPWGPRRILQVPAAPNITGTTVNLTTPGQSYNFFNSTPGTRYVVSANVGSITFGGAITDQELVLPLGYNIGQLNISGTVNRFRARGSVIGAHSGGQVLRVDLNGAGPNPINDVIFDGFKIGSTIEAFGYSIVQSDIVDRWAVVNCKIRSARSTFIGQARNMFWCGNSIQSGVYTSGQVTGGVDGGAQWTLRHGGSGPVVLYGNDIRGRKYHRFRIATDTASVQGEMIQYLARNVFVDEQEAAIAQNGILSGTVPHQASWAIDNDIYAYNSDGGGRFNWERTLAYARITNNRIRSNAITSSFLASQVGTHLAFAPGADIDYASANTYAPWSRPIAWAGAGDISDVVLPAAPILDAGLHAADLVGLAP